MMTSLGGNKSREYASYIFLSTYYVFIDIEYIKTDIQSSFALNTSVIKTMLGCSIRPICQYEECLFPTLMVILWLSTKTLLYVSNVSVICESHIALTLK